MFSYRIIMCWCLCRSSCQIFFCYATDWEMIFSSFLDLTSFKLKIYALPFNVLLTLYLLIIPTTNNICKCNLEYQVFWRDVRLLPGFCLLCILHFSLLFCLFPLTALICWRLILLLYHFLLRLCQIISYFICLIIDFQRMQFFHLFTSQMSLFYFYFKVTSNYSLNYFLCVWLCSLNNLLHTILLRKVIVLLKTTHWFAELFVYLISSLIK